MLKPHRTGWTWSMGCLKCLFIIALFFVLVPLCCGRGFLFCAHTGNTRLARIQANQWCFNGGGTAALQARRDQSHPDSEVRPSSLSVCAQKKKKPKHGSEPVAWNNHRASWRLNPSFASFKRFRYVTHRSATDPKQCFGDLGIFQIFGLGRVFGHSLWVSPPGKITLHIW